MRLVRGITALAATFAASAALADQRSDGPLGYDQMMWGGGYGMGGGLMMVLFWGIVIFLIVVAVRWFSDGKGARRQTDAMDILKERFAKGEIDEEEFQKRKTTLES